MGDFVRPEDVKEIPSLPDGFKPEDFNKISSMTPGEAKPAQFLSDPEFEAVKILAKNEDIEGLKKLLEVAKTRQSWMESQFPSTMRNVDEAKSTTRRRVETLLTEMPTYEMWEFIGSNINEDFDRTHRRKRPVADESGTISYETVSEKQALAEREARRDEVMPKWVREIAPEIVDPMNLLMVPRAGVSGFKKLAELALRGATLEGLIGVAETTAETGEIDAKEIAIRTAAGALVPPAFDRLFTKARSLNDQSATAMYNQVARKMQLLKEQSPNSNDYALLYRAVDDVLGPEDMPMNSRVLEIVREKGVPMTKLQLDKVKDQGLKVRHNNEWVQAAVNNPVFKGLANITGIYSTRLRRIAPHVAAESRKLEMRISKVADERLRKVQPFTEALKKVKKGSKDDYRAIKSWALRGGDPDEIDSLFSKYPELRDTFGGWKEVRDQIEREIYRTYGNSQKAHPKWKAAVAEANKLADDAVQRGEISDVVRDEYYGKALQKIAKEQKLGELAEDLLPNHIDNYFPRMFKKGKAFRKKLGGSAEFRKALRAEESRLQRKLTQTEIDLLQSRIATGKTGRYQGVTANFTQTYEKSRNLFDIDEVLDDLVDLEDSIQHYIHDTTEVIEGRKFWGRYNHGDEWAEEVSSSLDDNIGALIRKERAAGNLVEFSDEDDMYKILRARHSGGLENSSSALDSLRSAMYIPTIGDPSSTLVQIGDLATGAIVNGWRPTLASVIDLARSKTPHGRAIELGMKDFGLDKAAAELVGPNSTAGKILDKVLTTTGFRAMDRFGKNVIIGGALKDLRKLAKTNQISRLQREFGAMFSDPQDFRKFVNDLASGDRVTDDIQAAVWSRLSDSQPISKSEVPIPYLQHPNGRMLYQLKTWMLKQVDLARNKGLHEMHQGNYKEGGKFLTSAALAYAAFNTPAEYSRNAILGRDVSQLDPITVALTSPLKVYGMSGYFRDQIQRQGLAEASWLYVMPPFGALADPIWDLGEEALDPDEEITDLQSFGEAARVLPFGRFIYNWIGGGKERWNEYATED